MGALSSDPHERALKEAGEEDWTFPVGYDLTTEQMRTLGLDVLSPRYPRKPTKFRRARPVRHQPAGRDPDRRRLERPLRPARSRRPSERAEFIIAKDYPIRGTA